MTTIDACDVENNRSLLRRALRCAPDGPWRNADAHRLQSRTLQAMAMGLPRRQGARPRSADPLRNSYSPPLSLPVRKWTLTLDPADGALHDRRCPHLQATFIRATRWDRGFVVFGLARPWPTLQRRAQQGALAISWLRADRLFSRCGRLLPFYVPAALMLPLLMISVGLTLGLWGPCDRRGLAGAAGGGSRFYTRREWQVSGASTCWCCWRAVLSS